MNYWITTDTHFGHDKLIGYCERPKGFEDLILKRFHNIKDNEVLIHLGDFCIGRDEYWHNCFVHNLSGCKKWLVKGNHDRKSNTWYLNHGWDFVADVVKLRIFGLDILLSHTPQADNGFDVNVHGHFHNSDHRRHEPELKARQTEKHKLVMLEHHYQPQLLRRIVGA